MSAAQRHRPFALALVAGASAAVFGQTPASAPATTSAAPSPPRPQLAIRVVSAQTGKAITDERLNVSFSTTEIGFRILRTDKDGLIVLHPASDATIVHVLSNFYADCRPRGELYTNYSLADIRSTGITGGNLCSAVHPAPKAGELLLFVIPKTAIRQYGQPPGPTTLPHSDENPNAVPDNPPPVPR